MLQQVQRILLGSRIGQITIIALLLLNQEVHAQRTLQWDPAARQWDEAMDLYIHQKPGPARKAFEKFQDLSQDSLKNTEAAYYIARCAEELANPDAFARYFQITTQWPFHPKAMSARFHMGRIRFYEKNYKATAQVIGDLASSSLEQKEKDEYFFILGYSYFKLNDYEKALFYLDNALPENSAFAAKSNYYAGYILYMIGKNDRAIEKFNGLLDHETYGKVAPVYLAQLYYRNGLFSKVIEMAARNKVKELALDVQLLAGLSHFQLGNMSDALTYLEPYALQQKSLNDSVACVLGMVFFETGDLEKSAAYLLKPSARNDETGQKAAYYLGQVCLSSNKAENARSAFQQAAKAGSDLGIKERSAFLYAKLSAQIQPGHPSTIPSLQKFIKEYPQSPSINEAREILSYIYINSRQYARAIEALKEATPMTSAMKSQLAVCTYLLAEEKYMAGESNTAKELYTNALALPLDGFSKNMANYRLGSMAYEEGKYSEAISLFQVIPREGPLGPYYASALDYELGYAYLKTNQFQKASESFERFIKRESPAGLKAELVKDAWIRKADAGFMQRKYNEALEDYTYAIANKHPEADYALYQKAIISGLKQNHYEKINLLDKLIDLYPHSPYTYPALFELGFANWVLQRYEEAIEHFDALIQENPNTDKARSANLNIGLIFQTQNKNTKAIEQFRHVVLKYPESDEGRQSLSLLRDVYIEMGDKSSFDAFVRENKLGRLARLDLSEEDSLTYESAMNALRQKDTAKTIQNIQSYLEQYPEGLFAITLRFQRAEIYFKQGKKELALEDYIILADAQHQFAERSIRQSASIHFAAKRFDKALPFYRKAEKVASNPEFYQQSVLGQLRCALALKDQPTIKENGPKFLAINDISKESKIEIQFALARAFYGEDDEKCILYSQQVVKGPVSARSAECQYMLADIQYQKWDTLGCKKTLFTLIDKYPDYEYWVARGFILLSDNYLRMNAQLKAKQALQDVLENYEKDESDPLDILTIAKEKLKALETTKNTLQNETPQEEIIKENED